MCIGRELDEEAARAQLEACLLTDEEMVSSEVRKILELPDPFAGVGWGQLVEVTGPTG